MQEMNDNIEKVILVCCMYDMLRLLMRRPREACQFENLISAFSVQYSICPLSIVRLSF